MNSGNDQLNVSYCLIGLFRSDNVNFLYICSLYYVILNFVTFMMLLPGFLFLGYAAIINIQAFRFALKYKTSHFNSVRKIFFDFNPFLIARQPVLQQSELKIEIYAIVCLIILTIDFLVHKSRCLRIPVKC